MIGDFVQVLQLQMLCDGMPQRTSFKIILENNWKCEYHNFKSFTELNGLAFTVINCMVLKRALAEKSSKDKFGQKTCRTR